MGQPSGLCWIVRTVQDWSRGSSTGRHMRGNCPTNCEHAFFFRRHTCSWGEPRHKCAQAEALGPGSEARATLAAQDRGHGGARSLGPCAQLWRGVRLVVAAVCISVPAAAAHRGFVWCRCRPLLRLLFLSLGAFVPTSLRRRSFALPWVLAQQPCATLAGRQSFSGMAADFVDLCFTCWCASFMSSSEASGGPTEFILYLWCSDRCAHVVGILLQVSPRRYPRARAQVATWLYHLERSLHRGSARRGVLPPCPSSSSPRISSISCVCATPTSTVVRRPVIHMHRAGESLGLQCANLDSARSP